MSGRHLVVVGGGPAGLAAAVAGPRAGVAVTVIEERPGLGGNFHHGRLPEPDREGSPAWFERHGTGVRRMVGTAVVDSRSPGELTVSNPDGRSEVSFDALVIATGAHDRGVPIPGWTLPGVFTAGGALTMAKAHHVRPGRRVVVAGSGPFLLPVADAVSRLGARVSVLEATALESSVRGGWTVARDRHLAAETVGYAVRLARRGVRYRHQRAITRIDGDDRVREVVHARVDAEWRPMAGTERREAVDAVAIGFGFTAATELAQLLGCALRYDDAQRGYVVGADGLQRTSVAGVFAAGEATGFGGERVARVEGRLAGLAAAHTLGRLSTSDFESESRRALVELARPRRAARWLATAFRPRDGLWSGLGRDDTICRCEDVRLGQLVDALADNLVDPRAAKAGTRAGMGLCQGRICSGAITEILRVSHGYMPPAGERPWTIHPPLRPVPIGEWAAATPRSRVMTDVGREPAVAL